MKKIIILAIGLLGILAACTKTELVDYKKEENNRILEYKIATSTQEILGAIDNENNTITVYIPYFLGLSIIDATIKLDKDAVLLDSTGTLINLDGGLEPIPLGQTTKYFVESASGVKRQYTVIQKIVAHTAPLVVTYIDPKFVDGKLTKPVHSLLKLSGNFESTSTQAKFYFKDKATGKIHDNFVSVNNVVSGSPNYVMTLNILPSALAGDYEVSVEHLGRRANLPDIKLNYTVGIHGFFLSTTKYAPGEEITFKALGYQQDDNMNGVYIGLKRIYVKLNKQYLYGVPAGVTEQMYGQEFPLEIISFNRSEIKAKFPALPKGVYSGFYQWGKFFPYIENISMGFYFDFDEQTSWGNNVLLAGPSSMIEVL